MGEKPGPLGPQCYMTINLSAIFRRFSVAEVRSRTKVRTELYENWTKVQFKVQHLCWTGPGVQFRVQKHWGGSNRVRTDTGSAVPKSIFFCILSKIFFNFCSLSTSGSAIVHKHGLCNCSGDAINPLREWFPVSRAVLGFQWVENIHIKDIFL